MAQVQALSSYFTEDPDSVQLLFWVDSRTSKPETDNSGVLHLNIVQLKHCMPDVLSFLQSCKNSSIKKAANKLVDQLSKEIP